VHRRLRLIPDLLETADATEALAFLERHPDLRDVEVVHLLVNQAREAAGRGDDEIVGTLMWGASVLVETDDVGTLCAIADLFAARDAIETNPICDMARDLSREEFVGICNPAMAAGVLDTCAVILSAASRLSGDGQALKQSVALSRRAVTMMPPDSSLYAGRLGNLANRLGELHGLIGDITLIDEAVIVTRRATEIASRHTPERDDPSLPILFDSFAYHLVLLGTLTHDQHLVEEAVVAAQRSADLSIYNPALEAALVSNAADRMATVYGLTGDLGLLQRAIALSRRSVDLADPSSPGLARQLRDLSNHLSALSLATGELGPLREAVEHARRAQDTAWEGDPAGPSYSAALSNRLGELYDVTGDSLLLDEALITSRRVLELLQTSSPDFPRAAMNHSVHLQKCYNRTGTRTILDEAITLTRHAIDLLPQYDRDRGGALAHLGASLHELFKATNDWPFLLEAVSATREAVDLMFPGSPSLPLWLANLGNALGDLYSFTHEPQFLTEAVTAARRAVELTGAKATVRPGQLDNLANQLERLYRATGDPDALREAADLAEAAITMTPAGASERPMRMKNLASHLGDLSTLTGDTTLLKRARGLALLDAECGPGDAVTIGRTAANLARLDGDLRGATVALECAYRTFEGEVERLAGDVFGLRDLAGQTEGLLSDLAACYAVSGDRNQAVQLIERSRTWLNSPSGAEACERAVDVQAMWVITSRWETVVLCSLFEDPIVLPIGRTAMVATVSEAYNATRGNSPFGSVDALVALTTQITRTFPDSPDLVIVPAGICALLPFGAGRLADGRQLIESSTVTVAPSVSGLTSSARLRPSGGSFAAVHPGSPPLDLRDERQAFVDLFPDCPLLESPTVDDVLAHLTRDSEVAHFASHGRYNWVFPLQTTLVLGEELTIAEVLRHNQASWLVNLSACETGIPDVNRIDHLISLPTAFLRNGAAFVVSTLWSAENRVATDYNRRLYEEIQAGCPPRQAHRNAIREIAVPGAAMVRSGEGDQARFRHPFVWAPFTLYEAVG